MKRHKSVKWKMMKVEQNLYNEYNNYGDIFHMMNEQSAAELDRILLHIESGLYATAIPLIKQ